MLSTWICINVFMDINLDIVKGMISEPIWQEILGSSQATSLQFISYLLI